MTYTNLEVSELAYSKPLVRAMGTFFNHLSSDKEYYERLCQSLVEAYTEVWQIVQASSDQASPDTAGLMYNDRYRQLTINESDRRISNDGKFRFPLPADVVSICFIADKIERPAVMWAQGLDFAVEFWGGSPWLAISHDPFLTDGLEISSTLGVDNEIADRSVALWMVAAARNIYPLAEQWGTVFDVSPTTEDQRAHLLQLFKTMAFKAGTTAKSFLKTINCWAASLRQPFGCSRCFTKVAVLSFNILG